jgi:hypothetical protein
MPEARPRGPRRLPTAVVGLLIFLLALVPRLVGLGWGLPDRSRYYSYHPDEPVLLWAIHQVRFSEGQLSPRFYNYGSLYIYLCRALFDAAEGVGWVETRPVSLALPRPQPLTPDEMGRWVDDFARLHWLGRLIAAVLGALTAVAVYALGRRLYSESAGRVAGVFMAIAPLHLVHSHFLAVDVPATFWVALSLWAAAVALDRPRRPLWFLAGALAGLAAGTKYNTGLVALSALAALAIAVRRSPPEKRRDQALDGGVYLLLAVAIGFLFATPGVLIDTPQFRRDFDYERWHVGQGHGLVFIETAPGWIYHVTSSLAGGLGWPATLLCLAGVGLAIRRRRAADLLLLAYLVPYYLLMGAVQVKFARYMLPLFPVLAVWVGRMVVELWTIRLAVVGEPATEVAPGTAESRPAPTGGGVREGGLPAVPAATSVAGSPDAGPVSGVFRAAMLLTLAWTALYSVALLGVLVSPDSRTRAAGLVPFKDDGTDAPVALLQPPWFYTAPFSPAIGCTNLMARFCRPDRPRFRLIAPSPGSGSLTWQRLQADVPQYVVVNEFEYGDALRLAAAGTPNEMAELWTRLRQNYREWLVLEHRPRVGPLVWFSRSLPPHDLLYIMPTTRVFTRR